MKFKIRPITFSTGGIQIAIITKKDAQNQAINAGDRVSLKYKGKETTAIVDVAKTNKFIKEREVGIFEEVMKKLKIKRDHPSININVEEKPNSVELIKKKLNGKKLSYKEIKEIIQDIVDNKLTDIELSYFVAGTYTNKLTTEETISLTKAMINTGEKIDFKGKVIDKHCVGGVPGNRTTPIVVSILAEAGLKIPKTSSRAITSPAGTADTMEVITNVTQNAKKIKEIVDKTNGCMVWGGALKLAPADDAIIKVENPLSIDAEEQMIASILAKKGSVSSTHILIDIPLGKTAKVKTRKEAEHIAKMFKKIGTKLGMKINAIITDGSQPIGNGIGPALEAIDILKVLKQKENRPRDLEKKAIQLSGIMLEMGKKAKKGHGKKLAKEILKTGQAYKKFEEIVNAQGKKTLNENRIKIGPYKHNVKAKKTGKIKEISNTKISQICVEAGSPYNKSAGIYLHKHKHNYIRKGETIYTIYSKSKEKLKNAREESERDNGIIII